MDDLKEQGFFKADSVIPKKENTVKELVEEVKSDIPNVVYLP